MKDLDFKIGSIDERPKGFWLKGNKMKKVKLIQTCSSCPSQWEGYTDENEPVYIRYRFGHLSVSIGKIDQDIEEIYGWGAFGQKIGGEFDGFLSLEELKKQLKGKLDIEEIRGDLKDITWRNKE